LQSVAIGAGFVLSVVLDIVLIPPFGGQGAAFAAAIAHTTAGLVVCVIFLRTLGGGPSDLVPRANDVRWFAAQVSRRLRPKPA
jgi:Na+-driven multidrug efflux pump